MGETTMLSPGVDEITYSELSQSTKSLEFSSINKFLMDRIFFEANVIVHRVSNVD